MNNFLSNIINQFMTNKLQNNPVMNMFNQMMSGKTTEQQIQTLINSAKSRGIDDLIFTDHCDCNYEPATFPDMEPWPFLEVEDYWKYMNDLRNTSGYDFGIGLEIGQSTQELERANGIIASHECDFVIGSLHNLKHEYDFCLLDYTKRDVYKTFGDYFAELYDTAKINNFSVLILFLYTLAMTSPTSESSSVFQASTV